MEIEVLTSDALLSAEAAGVQDQHKLQGLYRPGGVLPRTEKHVPVGNSRRHEKAVFKHNLVEHGVEYLYNPPRAAVPIPDSALKPLVIDIAKRLGLDRSIQHSCYLYSRSEGTIGFAFVAFNLSEELLLKFIPMFDKTMMAHGWTKLTVGVAKLDGSVTRVNFIMRMAQKKDEHPTLPEDTHVGGTSMDGRLPHGAKSIKKPDNSEHTEKLKGPHDIHTMRRKEPASHAGDEDEPIDLKTAGIVDSDLSDILGWDN